MDALRISDGATVAELGAGGGWFVVRLARRVGPQRRGLRRGRPAGDDPTHPAATRSARTCPTSGPSWARATDPMLPPGLDAVLIVDAYREMACAAGPSCQDPVPLLKNVARSLKPRGRLGIVDFNRGEGGPGPAPDERVDPEAVIRAAGRGRLAPRTAREPPAVSVSIPAGVREGQQLPRVPNERADRRADHRRQRLERRRRHPGRPQDVRGAGRLRDERDYRHHRAEHGRGDRDAAAVGRPRHGADRSGRRRHHAARHQDRHARDGGDRRSRRRGDQGAGPAAGGRRPRDGLEERRAPPGRRWDPDAAGGAAAAMRGGHAEHPRGRSAERPPHRLDRTRPRGGARHPSDGRLRRRHHGRPCGRRRDRGSALRRRHVHRAAHGAHRHPEYPRHRLHLRVGRCGAPGPRTFRRRRRRRRPGLRARRDRTRAAARPGARPAQSLLEDTDG